jgi:hypothetical protein
MHGNARAVVAVDDDDGIVEQSALVENGGGSLKGVEPKFCAP